MDLNAVQMFVNVVQAGSLSAAASRLNTPLPTLSRRMRELEQDLKVQLLERSARGIKLTDAGTRLYEHALRGIEALLEAERTVRSDQDCLRGRLRLSLPPVFEPWWELLSAFQREYPGVQVSVYETERRVDLVQDGIDVALRVGAIMHEAMVARLLLAYRHVLVASPRLLRRLGEPVVPEDLHRYPCAGWSRDAGAPPVWRLGDCVFEPKAMLTTNNYEHLRSRALAGEAVTELPPFLAAQGLRSGHLCTVLAGHPLPEQQINLVYPSHRNPSSIVRAYLNFCQRQMGRFLSPTPHQLPGQR